jgi:soluble lytic murein transglycosylase-like protein
VLKLLTLTTIALAFCAGEARAEIVVLKNGRTMSVKSCRIDSNNATMVLREGGEVTFPASIVARVDPDEVPFDSPDERVGAPVLLAQGRPQIASAMLADAVLATRPYAALISTVAAANNLDARLVHAVIEQESNYEPRARSKKGAKGLMQLMPDTARQYGVLNSYDPKANLEAGVRHLKDLMSRLDLPIALAAYNAGEGTIKRYGGLPPFPETQTYVQNILRRVTAN